MKADIVIEWPNFYTATIYYWKQLLSDDKFKNIITNSLHFLVDDNRIILYAFVIMSNHIHLIWQVKANHTRTDVQLSFMRYTAQQMQRELKENSPALLQEFKVNKQDRKYQFWKREALSIELFTAAVFYQKLDYIHNNPVRAGLCANAEEYYYSSAYFYQTGVDKFGMLSHYG